MKDAELHAIVYTSTAAAPLSSAEIERLLALARVRNEREQITGLLLYAAGGFIQHIEGPEPGLQRVYADIQIDRRHRDLVELLREPALAREFCGWSMGYSKVSAEQMLSISRAKWTRAAATPVSGRQLLRSFWQRHQQIS